MLRHTITREFSESTVEATFEETGEHDLVRVISYRRRWRGSTRAKRVKRMEGKIYQLHQITGEPPPSEYAEEPAAAT